MDKHTDIITPAFAHPGGKRRLLKHILPLVPAHRVYVEPFAGGAAVMLAKAPSRLEVINDLDADLISFYHYVRWHRDALLAELATWPGNSSRNFSALLANPGYTDLQRAARWYWLKVSSFGAQGDTWGRDRSRYHGFDARRHGQLIERPSTRLQRVVIESRDWADIVDWYDSPDTFMFLDPPYVACGKTAYAPFRPEDMAAVRQRLDTLSGKWLLTCDDSPVCRQIFDGLPMIQMGIRYSIGNKAGAPKQSGELLVAHPALVPQGNIVPFQQPCKRHAG